ncbi:hypothetical protein ACWDSL_05470 [Streptomyces sp. NPDC000941]
MDLADMGAIAALLSVPVALITAWWNKRSAEKATDATLIAGRNQADASVAAVWVQGRNEHERGQHSALGDASAELLRATDALVRTVKRLPNLGHGEREASLAEHAMLVERAYVPLELLAPPDLLSLAKDLRSYCRLLERLALDRAVLRSTINALEAGWCQGNPETCDDHHHNAAYVAWQLLVDWDSKDDEERWRDRDLLEFCLRDTVTVSDEQVAQTLALADRCPAAWPQLIGGWIRDPLIERSETVRTAFVTTARTTAA